jgi:hypothetical protein
MVTIEFTTPDQVGKVFVHKMVPSPTGKSVKTGTAATVNRHMASLLSQGAFKQRYRSDPAKDITKKGWLFEADNHGKLTYDVYLLLDNDNPRVELQIIKNEIGNNRNEVSRVVFSCVPPKKT